MNVYLVDPDELTVAYGQTERVAACRPVVAQLVDRFDLAGQTLMSVGAGTAHEEVALLRAGMRRAFLFDVDEAGSLEPRLRRLHRPDRTAAPIVYRIGDFLETRCSRAELDPIHVLYFSGFTPEEMRRHEIAERHRREGRRTGAPAGADPDWPDDTSPLHDAVRQAIDEYLPAGGTFILQSYYGGVDPCRNPRYVGQWRQVLGRHGVTLLESYYFRAAPGVTLWIGRKGPGIADLDARPPITRFHTRAELADCSIARL